MVKKDVCTTVLDDALSVLGIERYSGLASRTCQPTMLGAHCIHTKVV